MFTGVKKREKHALRDAPSLQLKFHLGGRCTQARNSSRSSTGPLRRWYVFYPSLGLICICPLLSGIIVVRSTRRRTDGDGNATAHLCKVVGASRMALGHLHCGKLFHLLHATATHFRNLVPQTPGAVDATHEFTACVNIRWKCGSLG